MQTQSFDVRDLPKAPPLPLPIGDDLMKQVLSPYRPHTTYLKSAEIIQIHSSLDGDASSAKGLITAKGCFSIAESCYIDDTGHFNSVEFNICYNQLAYVLFAKSIQDGLFHLIDPVWASKIIFPFEEFVSNQLSSSLILKIEGKFSQPMDSNLFWGEVVINQIVPRGMINFTQTEVRFYDERGAKSKGKVTLAFVRSSP